MAKLTFSDLVAAAAVPLVRDHGFGPAGQRQYARDDGLLGRRVMFVPGTSLPGSFRFEVLHVLGINGLSDFSPRVLQWVVFCPGSHLRDVSLPRTRFELTGDAEYDQRVREAVVEICAYAYERFLLRHQSAMEFYEWLGDTAVEAAAKPRPLDDLLKYQLHPSNSLKAFEFASVYAAALGRPQESADLEEAAVDYAKSNRMRDYVPGIRAEIAEARRQVAATREDEAADSAASAGKHL